MDAMQMISATNNNHRILATFILLVVAIFSMDSACAARLYKWVDDQGQVHFSDKIPPQDIKRQHTEIDNNGLETKTVAAEKTPEELATEQRQQAIKAEQDRQAQERAEQDRILLETYSTEKEIMAARDRKLATMEATNQLTMGSIDSLTIKLQAQMKNAADYERQGQAVPDTVLKEIDDIKQEIEHHRAMIKAQQQEEEQLKAKYQTYIDRYRELKNR